MLLFLITACHSSFTSAQTWQKQGKTAIAIATPNGSCNSATDTVGITSDRSTLLTCQGNVWENLAAGTQPGCVGADQWSNSIGPYMSIPANGLAYRWRAYGYYTWTAYTSTAAQLKAKLPPNSNFYKEDPAICTNSAYPYKLERVLFKCTPVNGVSTEVVVSLSNFCFNSAYQFQ